MINLIRCLFLFYMLFTSLSVQATQIVIINNDGVGEGFNDATIASAVGGNSALTLGEQRLQVFEFAARIWESIISSNVSIQVEAKFDPLTCTTTSAVLGSAGTRSLQRDFPNAPLSSTWYAIALANSLAGSDLSTSADISATFNVSLDNNDACLTNSGWYYGLDGNSPANSIELLYVVLHELGHGLGFQTFVDISTGAKFGTPAKNDVYMLNLEDHSLNINWSAMTDAQRLASSTDTTDLHWSGVAVTSKTSSFSAGINQGHVEMYAPSPQKSGSSVSHFSTSLSPNELMEPFDTGPKQGPGLAKALLQDIGWNVFANFKPVISQIKDITYNPVSSQINFVIRDTDNLISALNVTAISSNFQVIDNAGLVLSGSTNTRTLTLSPQSAGLAAISITVSDGTASVTETFQLTVSNAPPIVVIDSPADNIYVAVGTDIVFQATANDVEDGVISSSISWLSSLDGALGSGGFITANLTQGVHSVSASVTDSFSASSVAGITINIMGDSDNDGMNDAWEINNFGDLTRDGTGDFDNNGIVDLDEYLIYITVPDGDINNDGNVDSGDLVLLTRHISNQALLSPLQIARGDIYPVSAADGKLNVSDMILLQKIIFTIP